MIWGLFKMVVCFGAGVFAPPFLLGTMGMFGYDETPRLLLHMGFRVAFASALFAALVAFIIEACSWLRSQGKLRFTLTPGWHFAGVGGVGGMLFALLNHIRVPIHPLVGWTLTLLITLLCVEVIFRMERRRVRHRPVSVCPACGYDLRGTPAPGSGSEIKTCPECGATSSAEPAGNAA
jgi:hypothetical protein